LGEICDGRKERKMGAKKKKEKKKGNLKFGKISKEDKRGRVLDLAVGFLILKNKGRKTGKKKVRAGGGGEGKTSWPRTPIVLAV